MKRICALLALAILFVSTACATAASMPQAGTAAPDFTLKSQEEKDVSLKQFRGQWVVLYFYPKDFTGGCTLEAHNFQDDLAKYTSKNAVILGVSFDTVDSHKSFCTKEKLNFKLLADTDGTVSNLYGSTQSYIVKTLSARNTFLIDPAGTIRKVYTGVSPAGHSAEVLADLSSLQAGAKK